MPASAQETTPAMVAAAEKEGKVVWYSSVDVKVGEAVKKAFVAKYPKIDVDVERSGSERVFQRINQEYQSNIKNVDVVNSSDASHFLFWKQQGWLAKHTPPDCAKYPPQSRTLTAPISLARVASVMGYNTNLIQEKDAPTGYADLLDPKWKGKLAKAHPGYSGTALTGTYAISKASAGSTSRSSPSRASSSCSRRRRRPRASRAASARSWSTATNTTCSSRCRRRAR
jgi:iron(III) transport system substrate-binding protein